MGMIDGCNRLGVLFRIVFFVCSRSCCGCFFHLLLLGVIICLFQFYHNQKPQQHSQFYYNLLYQEEQEDVFNGKYLSATVLVLLPTVVLSHYYKDGL